MIETATKSDVDVAAAEVRREAILLTEMSNTEGWKIFCREIGDLRDEIQEGVDKLLSGELSTEAKDKVVYESLRLRAFKTIEAAMMDIIVAKKELDEKEEEEHAGPEETR